MNRLTKRNGINYIARNKYCDYDAVLTDVQLESAYQQCVDKLGQLEDIEEKLGCPIELYFKMCIEGTSLYSLPNSNVIQWYHQYIYHKDFEGNVVFCLKLNSTLTPLYYVKDYGKTWALTREELENEL